MPTKSPWFSAQWVTLAITILLFVLVALFVDLKPVVDENFFFSTSDPGVQQSKKVEQRFPSQPQLILAVSSHDITSPRYLSRLQRMTEKIQAIAEVTSVKSLTAGPKTPADALASPFWRRLLVAKDQKKMRSPSADQTGPSWLAGSVASKLKLCVRRS